MTFPPPDDLNEKIRQQYEFLPYPESDLDYFPKEQFQSLFIHSLLTPYYLRYQQVPAPENAIILDAGCGSGVQALLLSLANPGAKVVGVDISQKSVELSRQRFAHHSLDNAEFHTLSLDDLGSLGYQFDYINCDEVLYLLPDPAATLKVFAANLKPRGIIRANLHSLHQRRAFFRSQEVFALLGLFDEPSPDTAIDIVKETLDCLGDSVQLKQLFKGFENQEKPKAKQIQEWILVNYLLQGDRGYTIADLFEFLTIADLEFISMVNWRQWHFPSLFKTPEDLPLFWQLGLAEASVAEQLQLFELFNPIHRLLDFWAIQPDRRPVPVPPTDWQDREWDTCRVHLHSALASEKVKQDLNQAISGRTGFQISQYIPLPTAVPITIDSLLAAAVLLPLWESPQPLAPLVERWLKLQPLDPLTVTPKPEDQARQEVQALLTELEAFTYVLLTLG